MLLFQGMLTGEHKKKIFLRYVTLSYVILIKRLKYWY